MNKEDGLETKQCKGVDNMTPQEMMLLEVGYYLDNLTQTMFQDNIRIG